MKTRNIFWGAIILITILYLFAQRQAAKVWAEEASNQNLEAKTRNEILDSLVSFVRYRYIDSTIGERLATGLEALGKTSSFKTINSPDSLVSILTTKMQAIQDDKHLRLLYDSEPRPMPKNDQAADSLENMRIRASATWNNFGFAEIKRLAGNVGYMKISRFYDPAIAGDYLGSVMTLLGNTDGLIIDLRDCGGGHGGTVELLISFLVESEPIHLSTMYDRENTVGKQNWTSRYVPGPRYLEKPVYVLINSRTFSAAEALAYNLQALKRATIVGERSRGGAHPVEIVQINEHFAAMIPVTLGVNAITGGDWEGTGVVPDTAVEASQALLAAHKAAIVQLKQIRPRPEIDVDYDIIIADVETDLASSKK